MYRIEKVEEKHIVLSDGNQRFRLERFCPHEAGDLSLGWIDGDVIRCPLHNLPFGIKTGVQPCKTLRNLKVSPES